MTQPDGAAQAGAGPIGGFFALEVPGAGAVPADRGLAALWGVADTPHAWANATSALAALLAHLRPGTVWLPGYVCAWVLDAVPPAARQLFPLRADLSPDPAALDGRLRPGDLVLAVDMFGRDPGPEWRQLVATHPLVTFVEDCAQALHTAAAPWGDWRLFSPRKLLGVPEGGLLGAVSDRARAQAADLPGPAEPPDPAAVLDRLAPGLARLERPGENGLWRPLHQAAEAGQAVGGRAMSRLARELLAERDPAPLAEARRRNFRLLAARLGRHALWPDVPDPRFAPFGFPVLLPPGSREALRERLHARGIFPAVHWPDIAAPPAMAADHARARRLLTLPCDHRYGPGAMDRLATAFEEALP